LLYLVGLGNKGDRYRLNRHNVGWLFLDWVAGEWGCSFTAGKGEYAHSLCRNFHMFKPLTYMNLSGWAVKEIVQHFKVPLDRLVVIYDDVDLPFGSVRFRLKGSAGTHNGMKSIIYHLETQEFPRVRIGVGKPPEGVPLSAWVLSNFSEEELNTLREKVFPGILEGLILYDKGLVERALEKINTIKGVEV